MEPVRCRKLTLTYEIMSVLFLTNDKKYMIMIQPKLSILAIECDAITSPNEKGKFAASFEDL